MGFLLKGAAQQKAVQEADAADAKRREEMDKMQRFWLKAGDPEAQITFIDGNLTAEGILDVPMFREHRLFLNGSWNNYFVCTSDTEPCPLCADGDKADLVGVMTILDHRSYQSKDGTKTYKDMPRLFVAKRSTLKVLQTLAAKRGGLAGCTFGVTRADDRQAAVGSSFDFEKKTPLEELKPLYMQQDPKTKQMVTKVVPADYEHEIVYRDAETLRGMGFGLLQGSVGSEPAYQDNATATPAATGGQDYSSEL